MKLTILLLGYSIGASLGQGPFGTDWTRGLMDSIDRLNADIQGNVQRVNQQIQESVQSHLAQVDRLNSQVLKEAGKSAGQMVKLGDGGSTIVISGAGGVSRSVFSGRARNGEPYFRDSEDRVVGNILHHTDRVYNPETKVMEEYKYTLDLSDPKAKPVPV